MTANMLTAAETMQRIGLFDTTMKSGGERDRKPNWTECLAFCVRQLPLPRRAIIDIAALDPTISPPAAKAMAMLFAYRTRLVLIGYRLALRFGRESTRSCFDA
jgi:hypothetical protein